MPDITRDEVAHLADLARIDLSDAELDHLAPQLSVILESVASISDVAADDVPPTSHALPLTNVFRDDVALPGLTAERGALRRPRGRAAALQRAADPGGGGSDRRDPLDPQHRRRAGRRAGGGRDDLGRADPRPPATATSRSTATCTRSCTSTPRARSPRPRPPTRGARPAAPPRGWTACRSRSRTCWPRRACRPRAAPGSSRAGCRRTTPPWSSGCAPRACRSSARPTWTSSRWARPPSTRPTARPTTRGTSTASPAARGAGPPRRSRLRGAAGHRHRHRRLDPPARLPSPARSGSSRRTAAVSRYGLVALANSLDQAGPVTRTVLDAALLHELIGGHDPRDSTSIDAAGPRRRGGGPAAARPATCAGCGSAWSGSSPARATRPGVQQRFDEAVAAAGRGRRRGGRGLVPDVRARARDVLPDPAGRGLLQPREVRRDALRPAGAARRRRGTERRGGDAGHPRPRLRRRGQAAHHPRHLRAVQRLLRRLLRPGAEGAHADQPRLRGRVRAGPTCCSRRPRPPRRSSWGRSSTTRSRCTSTTWPPSPPTSPASPASRCPAAWPTRTACRPASRCSPRRPPTTASTGSAPRSRRC